MREVTIPQFNMKWFETKMAALQKKAAKCKATLPTYTVVGEFDRIYNKDTPEEYSLKFFKIEMMGTSPKINGWEFVGRIEHHEAGNIIKCRKGFGESGLDRYYNTSALCEHCNTTRNRKFTYVVQNEDGKVLQVGNSCLKDFIGHASPNYYANLAELDYDLLELFQRYETENYGRGRFDMDAPLFRVLQVARAIIRIDEGYRTATAHGGSSTSNQTAYYFYGRDSKYGDVKHTAFVNKVDEYTMEKDAEEVFKVIDWAKKIDSTGSTFKQNMKIIASEMFLPRPNYGIACYILQAHSEFAKKKAAWLLRQELEALKVDEFIGDIKKRMEFVNLTYIKSVSFDHQFGSTYYHNLEDSEGRKVVIKGSKSMRELVMGFDQSKIVEVDEGMTVSIKATVKDHKINSYNNKKETIVNRAVVLKVA